MNCRELAKDFVVAGTASESLYGACESMFKPDMVTFLILLKLKTKISILLSHPKRQKCPPPHPHSYLCMKDHEDLFETISQALLSSVDRDCLSGWGGHVYIV